MRSIYLDYNASTPLAGAVRQAISPFHNELFAVAGNPHWLSRATEEAIEDARNQVSIMLGCFPSEIILTSGGTESINLALLGYAKAIASETSLRSKPQLIISSMEHAPVARTADFLKTRGWDIVCIPCRPDGSIEIEKIRGAICKRTRMISIQLANEQIGTIQDIAAIAKLTRPKEAVLHTDATQAMGKIEVDVDVLGVDLLSLSGHKMYAPKGVGALYVRSGTMLENIMHGGWQESGLRPGTENVPGIIGLGIASQLVKSAGAESCERLSVLCNRFVTQLEQHAEQSFVVHGHPRNRLPNTASIVVENRIGLELLRRVPELYLGLAIPYAVPSPSTFQGSSLHAIGVTFEEARSTIRVSVGWNTTDQEVDQGAELLGEAYRQTQVS